MTLRQKKRAALYAVFVAGCSSSLAGVSLFQDFIGKDAWIVYAMDHWTTAWLTVPFAGTVIFVACLVYLHAHHEFHLCACYDKDWKEVEEHGN